MEAQGALRRPEGDSGGLQGDCAPRGQKVPPGVPPGIPLAKKFLQRASGSAAAATHIAGLLSSGAANGDAAAAKITAMLLQPGEPQPAVDYPASNKGGLISHGSLQYTNPLQQEEPSERHAV